MQTYHLLAVLFLIAIATLARAQEEIHLQWAVCEKDADTALRKLGKGGAPPKKQNPISYYDTQPPVHSYQGLMFRTKTSKHEEVSMLKIRFDKKTSDLPRGMECVWDRYGYDTSYTCGKKSPLDQKYLWSDEQMRYAEHYGNITWNKLVEYGPYQDPKWKLKIKGHKAVFDDVMAGQLHLMEIEIKVPKSKSDSTYKAVTKKLKKKGVVLCDQQEGKTLRLFRALGYSFGEHDGDQNLIENSPSTYEEQLPMMGLDRD